MLVLGPLRHSPDHSSRFQHGIHRAMKFLTNGMDMGKAWIEGTRKTGPSENPMKLDSPGGKVLNLISGPY